MTDKMTKKEFEMLLGKIDDLQKNIEGRIEQIVQRLDKFESENKEKNELVVRFDERIKNINKEIEDNKEADKQYCISLDKRLKDNEGKIKEVEKLSNGNKYKTLKTFISILLGSGGSIGIIELIKMIGGK
jgi:hypothetical protein